MCRRRAAAPSPCGGTAPWRRRPRLPQDPARPSARPRAAAGPLSPVDRTATVLTCTWANGANRAGRQRLIRATQAIPSSPSIPSPSIEAPAPRTGALGGAVFPTARQDRRGAMQRHDGDMDDADTRPRIGFVLEHSLGHITHADNLRAALADQDAIAADIYDVPWETAGLPARIPGFN